MGNIVCVDEPLFIARRQATVIQMPHTSLGLTRFEFDGAGIAFRIWTRPVVSDGGKAVTPVTLLWRHPDGTSGKRSCDGFVEATEYAAMVVVQAGEGRVLTR